MSASSAPSSIPTPLPDAVTCREDIDGVHIQLPPPTWSQRPTLHSLGTICAGLIGFALSFVLGMMTLRWLNLPAEFGAGFGFAGMLALMQATDKLRTWHHSRLHRVHLTLTPSTIEVKHRRYSHRAYLSESKTSANGAMDLWRDDHNEVMLRIGSQPAAVREWTTLTLQAWLQQHLPQQGSHDEVPRQLLQLSSAVKTQP